MTDSERRTKLEEVARDLRASADELRALDAPAESVKVGALASAVELRIKRLDAVSNR